MKEFESIYFSSSEAFRSWLHENWAEHPGIWMIYFKKHLRREGIEYQQALDEALSFGWIDSLVKNLDEERYARKFMPRKDKSKWSDFNRKKLAELIRDGRMTQAGLDKVDPSIMTSLSDISRQSPSPAKPVVGVVPDFILLELAQNEPALQNFNQLSTSCRKQYVLWITQAKREETIQKRLSEAIEMLKENKKLGLK
jgi:uncharacterized protein YdeI (YjbR/CyaY-like superfamily)